MRELSSRIRCSPVVFCYFLNISNCAKNFRLKPTSIVKNRSFRRTVALCYFLNISNCEKNFWNLSSRIVAFVVIKRVNVYNICKKYLDEVIERTMPIIKNSLLSNNCSLLFSQYFELWEKFSRSIIKDCSFRCHEKSTCFWYVYNICKKIFRRSNRENYAYHQEFVSFVASKGKYCHCSSCAKNIWIFFFVYLYFI